MWCICTSVCPACLGSSGDQCKIWVFTSRRTDLRADVSFENHRGFTGKSRVSSPEIGCPTMHPLYPPVKSTQHRRWNLELEKICTIRNRPIARLVSFMIRVDIYIYIYVCVCVCMCVLIYLFIYLFVYLFIYKYVPQKAVEEVSKIGNHRRGSLL